MVGTHIHTFCSLLPFLSLYSLYLQLLIVVVDSDPRSHSTAHVSPCLTWLCTYLLGTLFVFFFSSIHIFFAPRSSVLPMNSRNSGGGSHSRLNPPPSPPRFVCYFLSRGDFSPISPRRLALVLAMEFVVSPPLDIDLVKHIVRCTFFRWPHVECNA